MFYYYYLFNDTHTGVYFIYDKKNAKHKVSLMCFMLYVLHNIYCCLFCQNTPISSKDFGSSGFRFGVLCTQNKKLVQALGTINIFSSVSHPIQKLISNMLEDDSSFVDEFLEKSGYKLHQSYKKCIASLDDMSIPYVDAIAGMFVYCDFSSLLPPPPSSSSSPSSFEREAKFFSIVTKYAHIVMTPGEAQRECPEKVGMFRICYAYVPLEVLDIAMRRLKKIAGTIVEVGWENLDPDIHFKDVLDA